MVHVPVTFLSEWCEFPSAPDMLLSASVTRKDNSAHEQTPLSSDTIDSVLRHQEVGRANDLSVPPGYCAHTHFSDWNHLLT